ncbi:MAG: hypothetical protein LBU39_06905 [Desulfobulbaceae bacterium]|jgi:hypothetical protein|nr:hypothetical protein [Desulfobulbaceae bacterium]
MTIKRQQYKFTDGKTPLSSDTFNALHFDIDARLHDLETLRVSWQQAIIELQNFGVSRIDVALLPLLQQGEQSLAALNDQRQAFLDWQSDKQAEIDGVIAAKDELAAIVADLGGDLQALSNLLAPPGVICAWLPGWFTSQAGGFSGGPADIAAANALVNPRGWYVCNGAELLIEGHPWFGQPGRYLPNLSNSRFLAGTAAVASAGLIGQFNLAHSHSVAAHTHVLGAHSHTGPSHSHGGVDHLHSLPSHQHTVAAHYHNVNSHTHTYGKPTSNYGSADTGAAAPPTSTTAANLVTAWSGASGAADRTLTTGAAGTGATGGATPTITSVALNAAAAEYASLPPDFLQCLYIMKVV